MKTIVKTEVLTAVPDLTVEEATHASRPILDLTDPGAPEAVDAWLKGLDQSAICGTSRQGDSCPLATYLDTTARASGIENPYAMVGGTQWGISDAEGERHFGPHPGWVKRFITAVDARRGKARSVTARVARRLLRESLEQGYD